MACRDHKVIPDALGQKDRGENPAFPENRDPRASPEPKGSRVRKASQDRPGRLVRPAHVANPGLPVRYHRSIK